MQRQRILLTGCTGFIGNHVIMKLLADGHEVIASSSSQEKAAAFPWYAHVDYRQFSLLEFDAGFNYAGYFGNPDRVIHLAWEGLPNYKSLFHFEENLLRHYNFLKNLVTNGVRDLTVSGTCLEYGLQEGCLSEYQQPKPSNPYGIAKDTLRKFLEELQKETTFTLKWIRLFYLYGPGQNPNSILSQLQRALEEGKDTFNMSAGNQTRDYLPVEKAADYIRRIALQHRITGIINCCSGSPVTIRHLVEDYLARHNQSIRLNLGYYPYPDYEPMHFWGDNQLLTSILNNE